MELRETVTADDAHDVVELMKSSMMDIFTDDLGGLDYQRSQNGSGMSKSAFGCSGLCVVHNNSRMSIAYSCSSNHLTVQRHKQRDSLANSLGSRRRRSARSSRSQHSARSSQTCVSKLAISCTLSTL
jgi:DNA replicative helicase MCM subunit Mcm2 (Cdc46/Mcm family)